MPQQIALKGLLVAFVLLSIANVCRAGEADVIEVKASRSDSGTYTFNVTIGHTDTGWDHYADRWEVLSSNGKVIASRILLHPHVSEQPFTRSLSGVAIPTGETTISVRAHDSIHEFGGKEIDVQLSK